MKKLLFILSLLLSLPLSAQQIDVETASQKAQSVWTKGTHGKRLAPAQARPTLAYTAKMGDEVQFYVFNNAANGFVIIGGDESAVEILGQSDNGNFDVNNLPTNFKWYLSQLQGQIHAGIQAKTAVKKRVAPENRHDVTEMVTSEWDQNYPYYNKVIEEFGTAYPTGCVATAMAQIMYYWKYPERGTGSNTYTPMGLEHEVSVDFSQSVYDWNNMIDQPFTSPSVVQNAISKLIFDCGVGVNMVYAKGASAASQLQASKAFVKYFKYDKACQYLDRGYYSDEDWDDIMYNELAAGRPMLYGGVDYDDGGHAFVCDGYRASDNTYHFNWGWSGQCNGYFATTGSNAMKPTGIYQFNLNQTAIIGIEPDKGSEPVYNITTLGTCGFTVMGAGVSKEEFYETDRTEAFLMYEGLFSNYGNCTIEKGEIGVKIVKDNGGMEDVGPNIVQYLNGYTSLNDFDPGNMKTAMYIYPSQINANGLYYCYPVFRIGTGEWQDMSVPQGWIPPMLLVEGNEPALYLLEPPTMPNDHYFTNDNIDITCRVYNTTDGSQSKWIDVNFQTLNGSNVASLSVNGTFPPGESTLHITQSDYPTTLENLEPGTDYKIQMRIYGTSTVLCDNYYVHCVGQKNIPYTLSSAKWGTLILPYDAEIPEGLTVYSTDYYANNGSLELVEQDKITRDTPYIIGGEPGDYNFSGPDRVTGNYHTAGLLTGVMNSTKAVAGSYVLLKKNGVVGFYRVVSGNEPTVGANRAYLSPMLNCPLSCINFPSATTTGIELLQSPAKRNFYQLNPFIRIENGQKILSK